MPSDKREKRQRQKEARAQRREAARKAAARRELMRRIGIALGLGAVVAVLLLFAGAFSGRETASSAYLEYRAQPTACGAEAPPPTASMSFEAPDGIDLPTDARITATLRTSCGVIVIELDPETAPATVNSFVFLVQEGFYNGTVFHRVMENFVIQGGDPDASGRGGPGYVVEDELPPEGFTYEPGVVAMANAGRGTTGSQFFIAIGPRAEALPPSFNPLGRVVDGFDTLERIASVPVVRQPNTVEESKPLETVYIESASIEIGD